MSTQASNETEAATPSSGKTLLQRAQHGWPARYPLVQLPNAPLLIALAGLLVAALATGSLHDYARATFFAAVAVWAWLELAAGVNWPRRVLGAAGLVYVVAMVGQALGA